MSEYVVNPELAHGVIKDADTKCGEGEDAHQKVTEAASSVASALNNTSCVGLWETWAATMATATTVAYNRVDNAVGAGHQVIDTLEAADIEMSAAADKELEATALRQIKQSQSMEV